MQSVLAKHSEFAYEIVKILPPEDAKILEQTLIDQHMADPSCVNLCNSSEIPSRKGASNTPAHRAAISAARSGHVPSAETRARMSASQKARFANGWPEDLREKMMSVRNTPEFRKKLSEAGKGKTLSEKTRRKISEAGTGRTVTEKTRDKLSKALHGRQLDPEVVARIAAANTGRKASEETKAKMRDAQRKRQERERLARLGEMQ